MKKYLSILAIFAVAAVACNKVEPQAVEETPEVVSGTNTVSFRANLPAFGVESKATISDTGEFAWEEDDCIYVLAYSNSENSLWYIAFKYNTTTKQFTCDFPVIGSYTGFTEGVKSVQLDRVATAEEAAAAKMAFALYPDPQAATTEVAYDRVQKFFKMEGSLNAGKIEFEHKSAMVNVHIANVPSFASYFTVAGGTEAVKVVNLNGATSIDKAIPITPTGSASEIVITLYDSANNVIISKKKTQTLVAGTLYDTPVITVGPVIDIKKYATSWDKAYVYLFTGEGTFDTEWSNLSSVMKTYNDGEYDHYYRILPSAALGNTYNVIVFNSEDDTYRVRTSMTIENQNDYSVSQKEGLRKIGDASHRFILRDEALGTDKDSNPDTYLYIKSITGVDGDGFTGSWESDGTKALGWFIGKRNGTASGRYYYFNTDAIKNYVGYWFTFEYTMYKEGDHSDQWRGLYNVSLETGYSDYFHVGVYYDSYDENKLKAYVDNDFDSQMSE